MDQSNDPSALKVLCSSKLNRNFEFRNTPHILFLFILSQQFYPGRRPGLASPESAHASHAAVPVATKPLGNNRAAPRSKIRA